MAEVTGPSRNQDPQNMALTAIDLCRAGNWFTGLPQLRYVAKHRSADEKPGVFYSYLGYGLASLEKKYQQGLDLCKTGVTLSEFDGEPYLYLAKTYMLFGRKKPAIDALDRGLRVDPQHRKLLEMRCEFGWRKPLAVPSLSRGHFLNRVAGELRTLWRRPQEAPAPAGLSSTRPEPHSPIRIAIHDKRRSISG